MVTLKDAADYGAAVMLRHAAMELACPSLYDVAINPEQKRWCMDLNGPCGVKECDEGEGDA